LLADSDSIRDSPSRRESKSTAVQPVQFVDGDDATVELLPDDNPTLEAAGKSLGQQGQTTDSAEIEGPREELPGLSGDEAASSARGDEPDLLSNYASEWDAAVPCPECGGYHFSAECEPHFSSRFEHPLRRNQQPLARFFADVEFNFLRTHLNGAAVGKLSEKYEFSPRVIIGFRDTGLIDGRARFWHYDHETPVLNGNSPIGVQFDVLDLEGTHLVAGRRSEVRLAGGLRIASIDLTDNDDDRAGADLLGMTLAAEGRTWLGSYQGGRFALVYGGRLSILGGDWGAEQGSDFLPGLTQDDNVVVHELLAGVDYAVCHGDVDFHARVGFEMQNWQSDALAPDSIGIIGPGIQFGAEF
jgi:hypothetical protein